MVRTSRSHTLRSRLCARAPNASVGINVNARPKFFSQRQPNIPKFPKILAATLIHVGRGASGFYPLVLRGLARAWKNVASFRADKIVAANKMACSLSSVTGTPQFGFDAGRVGRKMVRYFVSGVPGESPRARAALTVLRRCRHWQLQCSMSGGPRWLRGPP